MTIAATVSGIQGQTGAQNPNGNAMENLSMDEFLKMMIAELQNQDPLNPMDNTQILQQIGQIREIGATDSLTRTLTNLSASQELVTASSLIGQAVQGLADDASEVNGVVDRITVVTNSENNARSVKVHVGDKTMEIKNVREIQNG